MFDRVMEVLQGSKTIEMLTVKEENTISLPGLTIYPDRRKVYHNRQEIPLTATEYDLLCLLAANRGRVLAYAQIYEKVWGSGVIITKDYSRLGRDYLEVGNYMECIFPLMQVRYISVNDGYDSKDSFGSTGGMDVVLKNIVNAMYCQDASRKVRSAKKILAQQGKYIASFAPFGYRKSAADKHVLEPDPDAAPVVRLIF